MKKLIITVMLVLAASSILAQKTVWRHLDKDKPDPTKAVLAVTSNKPEGLIRVTKGNTAYELLCPINSKFNFTQDNEEKSVRYYYIEPGEYEFTAYITSIFLSKKYPMREMYTKNFNFTGSFRLEAGKAYYFGHVIVNIPINTVNNVQSIDPDAKQTCTIDTNVENRVMIREKFQKNLPKVFNSVKGEIEQVVFLSSQSRCNIAGKFNTDRSSTLSGC